MSVQRIIPVLLHKHGRLVLSREFSFHHDIGDPFEISQRLKSWDLDELIVLDISSHWPLVDEGDLKADMFAQFCDVIDVISQNCFVPLSVGGGIHCIEQIQALMHVGADRIIMNSAAVERPDLITECAARFGAQAIIVGIDVLKAASGEYHVYSQGGRQRTQKSLKNWVKTVQTLGAGEVFVQSIDRDGQASGFDKTLLNLILDHVDISVIFCGGAGKPDDLAQILNLGAKAAAAANIFNFSELSYKQIKDSVEQRQVNLRPSMISTDYVADKHKSTDISRFNVENEEIWQELSQTGLME